MPDSSDHVRWSIRQVLEALPVPPGAHCSWTGLGNLFLTRKNEIISGVRDPPSYSTFAQRVSVLNNRVKIIHQMQSAGGL
jgi:hypothetical protein